MDTAPKAIVRRVFEDVMSRGDLGAVDELLAKDVVFTTVNGDVLRGRSAFKHFAEQVRTAFPDIRFDIEAELQDGDRVCSRYVMRGTFLSTLMGLPPNGASFAVRGIDIFRVRDGKVDEIHASYDTLGQLQQLGIVPRI